MDKEEKRNIPRPDFDFVKTMNHNGWQDRESFLYWLAIALGIVDERIHSYPTNVKWLFWSNNKWLNFLDDTFQSMIDFGLIETKEEDDDIFYRFNDKWDVNDM